MLNMYYLIYISEPHYQGHCYYYLRLTDKGTDKEETELRFDPNLETLKFIFQSMFGSNFSIARKIAFMPKSIVTIPFKLSHYILGVLLGVI